MEPRSQSPTGSTGSASHRGIVLAAAVVFLIAGLAWGCFWLRAGMGIFKALASLSAWSFVVTVGMLAPRLPFQLRPALLTLLSTAPIAWLFWISPASVSGATNHALQLGAVLLAVFSFGFHFLATYAARIRRDTPTPGLAALVPLIRLLAAAHALVVTALLVQLYGARNWFPAVQSLLTFGLLALAGEAALRLVFRFYQPRRLRSLDQVFGHSALLSSLFGESGPIRSLASALEKTFGVKLRDAWIVRLAGMLIAPLLLLGGLALWLSTAITRIPTDARGVLISKGSFQSPALSPGLHLHAPWPWAQVVTVTTDKIQEVSLGFERDLAGPVLWTEKHFEGEQNLLVGQGEELLTINVPIHYRVKDAVACLRNTTDAASALQALGSRELLALTTSHTAFGLMTTDRAEVTEKLRSRLQLACDRLGLGLEIVFVGLQDVHPPVPVAPAYQDVISAEEDRLALIDRARTYSVQTLGSAGVASFITRVQADAAAASQRLRATSGAGRFLAPLATYREHPAVLVQRLRLEAFESALAEVGHLYVVPSGSALRRSFFLGPVPATATSGR